MKRKTTEATQATTKNLTLGDLVAMAFAHAELVTGDPARAAHLAARAIGRRLAARPRLARALAGA